MSAIAVKPRRLSARERAAMTPEEELQRLIAEQSADDTFYVDRHEGDISLDAPTPDGMANMSDLIGVWEDGSVEVFFRPNADTHFDEQKGQHGTTYGYTRLRCRCGKCKSAWSAYMREYRKRAAR